MTVIVVNVEYTLGMYVERFKTKFMQYKHTKNSSIRKRYVILNAIQTILYYHINSFQFCLLNTIIEPF